MGFRLFSDFLQEESSLLVVLEYQWAQECVYFLYFCGQNSQQPKAFLKDLVILSPSIAFP